MCAYIYGNVIGGVGIERTYILVDDDGNEFVGVMVDKETELTAGANDIRSGKVAANVEGVVIGEKAIPAYNTAEGYRVITNGSDFTLPIEYYDYTKMQALICEAGESIDDTIKTDRVVIDGKVYEVNSTDVVSEVIVDHTNREINFSITNESSKTFVIRYFVYKEIY